MAIGYKSLLVHLDDASRCEVRTRLALNLARRWGAHLTGLSPTGLLPLSVDGGPGLLGLDTLTSAVGELKRLADGRGLVFRERCREAGLPSFDAVVEHDDSLPAMVRLARSHDLLVAGQADVDSPGYAQARNIVEELVLQNPRPTLLVPSAGDFPDAGEDILVAWSDTRECARALADALPWMVGARRVVLMRFETALGSEESAPLSLEASRAWLARHGARVDIRQEVTEIDVGNALLSRAADLGSDLIVMGAYGHPRWSERVLGGVTRTVLEHMTVPVLMSH